ncbi:unnamed protein product [Ceutorhynchus assimilis]|uniref:Odorant receptor n=1 Tax=Ceutorhynchus assimilis TaxID=467358 RepID=A0A9N9MQQ0_9CUCU|nr:unnamed protein product [Ceutorhynchus assimilis]
MSMFEFIKTAKTFMQSILATYPKREFSLVYRIRNLFSMGLMITLFSCLTYQAVLQVGDFLNFSKSIFFQITVMNNCIRVLIMAYKRKEILKCIDMLNTPSFVTYNEQYSFDFKKLKKIYVGIMFTHFTLANISLFGYATFPIFQSNALLPLEFSHFNSGIFYYPFYLYEVIAMCTVVYSLMGTDFFNWGFLMISGFQLRKLNRKLADMGENVRKLPNYSKENFEKLSAEYLEECCSHYTDIEEFSKCVQDCFGIIYAIQMLSLEILTSCYFSCWYEYGTSIRRSLFILMERAKRPIEVQALGLITLSLETFISILKWTYSYFALLRDYS